MTNNDLRATEALINIPIRNSRCDRALRDGHIAEAIEHAEEMTKHIDNLRRRLKELANIFREPMGG